MNQPSSRRSRFASGLAASALLLSLLVGCGRGPLTPPPGGGVVGTIQFQINVAGSITQSQGDYIIAVNAVTPSGSSVNPGESAGMPTIAEAQSGSFTHWDQEFVYGFDTTTAPNGFNYSYKVLGTGTNVVFVPIILTSNQFVFNPAISTAGGTNNTLSITLPISALSIRSNPSGSNPPTVTTPAAVLLHVNYITLATDHSPQDQLGCCSVQTTGYDLVVDLTTHATYFNQLTTPPGKQGPPNPNLFITGGQIIVTPGM
jgi:hypothetical protein